MQNPFRGLTEMETCRYSVKSNAGKGFSKFITNFNIAGEFDPAWLDSNDLYQPTVNIGLSTSATQHGWIQLPIFWVLIYRFKPMRNFGSSADQPRP